MNQKPLKACTSPESIACKIHCGHPGEKGNLDGISHVFPNKGIPKRSKCTWLYCDPQKDRTGFQYTLVGIYFSIYMAGVYIIYMSLHGSIPLISSWPKPCQVVLPAYRPTVTKLDPQTDLGSGGGGLQLELETSYQKMRRSSLMCLLNSSLMS